MERLLARPVDGPRNRLGWLLATFCYTWATHALTLALSAIDTRFQALWLSNGVFLVALLLAPVRLRAELCLAAFLAYVLSGGMFGGAGTVTLVRALCYTIEAMIACLLIERTPGGRIDLTRLRGFSYFLVATGGVAPMISGAVWNVWQTFQGHPLTPNELVHWQVSHALGLLVMVPAILAIYSRIIVGWNLTISEISETVFHALAILGIASAVFAQPFAILYLIIPFLCLAAFRTGFLGASLAVIVVAVVATTFTVLGMGPITHTSGDPVTRIFLIQVFVACCTLTSLPICVVLTDRKRLSISLSASERRFRELADAAPIGIFTIAPDLRITYANQELAQISGRPVEILLTERIGASLEPETRQAMEAALRTCNSECRLAEMSFAIRREDGERWFQVHFGPTQDDGERQNGWIGTVMDVTALRRSEQRAMSAVAARSRFLAVMSHEVRTPMTGVLATFELLAQQSRQIDWPIPDMPRLIASTQAQARSLMGILNNVLDQAKLDAGRLQLEAVDFDPMMVLADVAEVFVAQAQAKGIILNYSASGPGRVTGDPGRLQQIAANLLSNALKFTADGSVTLSCRDDGSEFYAVVVEDTGIGISSEAMASITEPFTQAERSTNRRFGGTGLGLSIVGDIANAMGGKLEIESAIGIGSTFTVKLPKFFGISAPSSEFENSGPPEPAPLTTSMPEIPAVVESKAVSPRNDTGQGVKVLVVDDTDATRTAAVVQLQVMGHVAVGVSSGIEAILEAAKQQFDIILVDSAMPGMDGASTIRLLQLLPTVHGIASLIGFTAYTQSELQQDLLDAGARGILTKPFTSADLQKVLSTTLARPRDPISTDAQDMADFLDNLAAYPPPMRMNICATLATDIERLKKDLKTPSAHRALHSLKGVAGSFGLTALYNACAFYENCPDDRRIKELAENLVEISTVSALAAVKGATGSD